MSIYHCSIKIGSRSKGQSAIAASAYRVGAKLTDNETGLTSDYTRKQGVIFSEVMICENAPVDYLNREILWNAVHEVEKSKNAQLWREIEVALPRELKRKDQIRTVQEYVKYFIDKGMCADWALHDKGDGNPHAHIMLTTRPIEQDGTWSKLKEKKEYALDEHGERIPLIDEKTGMQKVDSRNRKQWKRITVLANEWNSRERAEEWRALWAECCNKRLSEHDRIDHRSYVRQGITQVPTVHEGYVARKIVASGGISKRIELNQQICSKNAELTVISDKLHKNHQEIQQIKKELHQQTVNKKPVKSNSKKDECILKYTDIEVFEMIKKLSKERGISLGFGYNAKNPKEKMIKCTSEQIKLVENLETKAKQEIAQLKKKEPEKDTPLFSRDRIMSDEFAPKSQSTKSEQSHHNSRGGR